MLSVASRPVAHSEKQKSSGFLQICCLPANLVYDYTASFGVFFLGVSRTPMWSVCYGGVDPTTMIKTAAARLASLFAATLLLGACENKEEDPGEAWKGNTYRLEILGVDFLEPRGVGSELDGIVPNFVLRVEDGSQDDLEILIGTASPAGGAVQTCSGTVSVSASAQSYPSVQIGPVDVPIYVVREDVGLHVPAHAYGLTLVDVLPGGELNRGTAEATVDIRELYPLVTVMINPSPEAVCTTIEPFNPCQPCPTDGAAFCLHVKAIRLDAVEANELDLQPIDPNQVPASCWE